MKVSKGFILFMVVCVVIAIVALVAVMFSRNSNNSTYLPPVACTLEAKLCPDGSYVGRDPARNCEFTKCPGESI